MILPSMKLKNSSAVGGENPKGRSSASPLFSVPFLMCVRPTMEEERKNVPADQEWKFLPIYLRAASGKVDIFLIASRDLFSRSPPLYFHRIVAARPAPYITRREVGKTRHQREERKGCELSLLLPLLLLLSSWGKLVPTQKSHVP